MEEVNESHMKNYSFTSMLYDDTEPGYVINPENIFNMNKLKSVEIDLTCGNGVMSDSGTNQSFVSPSNNCPEKKKGGESKSKAEFGLCMQMNTLSLEDTFLIKQKLKINTKRILP